MVREGQATLEEFEVSEEIQQLLIEAHAHAYQEHEEAKETEAKSTVIEDPQHVHPYQPTLLGLERARRDCRAVMLQIVEEVC
jgi:hypothetical protein